MSEAEKKRRAEYKQNRKKWLTIQFWVIVALAIVLIFSSIMYLQLSKTVYIDYSENSRVDYKVKLNPNEFYEDEWLDSGFSYVANLIDEVAVTFDYDALMDTENVSFEYSCEVFTEIRIVDDKTDAIIYNPKKILLPEYKETVAGQRKLNVQNVVKLDYKEYNDLVYEFVEFYDLKDVSCYVDVVTVVTVLGNCPQFEQNTKNEHTSTLTIPLLNQTVKMKSSASAPAGVTKVLACVNYVGQEVFKIITIVSGTLTVLAIIGIIIFAYTTRNYDINYTIKVKRIVSSYKSYIQKIENVFDTTGYNVLRVSTFVELLGIRDTIQSPVLMSENEDKTCTTFFIPTNTNLLYVYELKVENYDEIYGVSTENK